MSTSQTSTFSLDHIRPTARAVFRGLLEAIEAEERPALSVVYRVPRADTLGSRTVPRPPNEFVLFKSWMSKGFGRHEAAIAGELWHELQLADSPVVRHFSVIADLAKQEHSDTFPDYRYQPRGRNQPRRRNRPYFRVQEYHDDQTDVRTAQSGTVAYTSAQAQVQPPAGFFHEFYVVDPTMVPPSNFYTSHIPSTDPSTHAFSRLRAGPSGLVASQPSANAYNPFSFVGTSSATTSRIPQSHPATHTSSRLRMDASGMMASQPRVNAYPPHSFVGPSSATTSYIPSYNPPTQEFSRLRPDASSPMGSQPRVNAYPPLSFYGTSSGTTPFPSSSTFVNASMNNAVHYPMSNQLLSQGQGSTYGVFPGGNLDLYSPHFSPNIDSPLEENQAPSGWTAPAAAQNLTNSMGLMPPPRMGVEAFPMHPMQGGGQEQSQSIWDVNVGDLGIYDFDQFCDWDGSAPSR